MSRKILHVLAQRPKLTGSGTTLDAFGTQAALRGWSQHAVVGVPLGAAFEVAGVEAGNVHPLYFENEALPFKVPGMSDVMPYPSTVWSAMTESELDAYRREWTRHLSEVVSKVAPDLILSHHVWIVSGLLKDVAPDVPVVTECHSTGLRQMALCPHLKDEVVRGVARNDQFLVLRKDHGEQLREILGVGEDRVHVVGAGYNDALFHSKGRAEGTSNRLLYVGKLSKSKGLPWLLDAVESLSAEGLDIALHVAGAGTGDEGDRLRGRLEGMKSLVTYHGQLDQMTLADLARTCEVCVLPSFYEGVPLVLVEALACGCKLVATELPGVVDELCPHLGDNIERVPLPRLVGIDTPNPEDLPAFTANLANAIRRAFKKPSIHTNDSCYSSCLTPFTWSAVFDRVESVLLDTL